MLFLIFMCDWYFSKPLTRDYFESGVIKIDIFQNLLWLISTLKVSLSPVTDHDIGFFDILRADRVNGPTERNNNFWRAIHIENGIREILKCFVLTGNSEMLRIYLGAVISLTATYRTREIIILWTCVERVCITYYIYPVDIIWDRILLLLLFIRAIVLKP